MCFWYMLLAQCLLVSKVHFYTQRILTEKNATIYVAGHTGMVGSAIVRRLQEQGFSQLILRSRKELDLCDQTTVRQFFMDEKPEYVFNAAARVGGIHANNTYRAQFIYENLQIQNNLIHYAKESGVKKLLFLGSSCIYPRNASQPMKEETLSTGPLEPTNELLVSFKVVFLKQIRRNVLLIIVTGSLDIYDFYSHEHPTNI